MVEVKKDDRIVRIEGDVVVFNYINEQHYTKEQARNLWVGLKYDLLTKTNMIKQVENKQIELDEQLKIEVDRMIAEIKTACTDISDSQFNVWKKVQIRLNKRNAELQIEKLKIEIKNLEEGLKIWSCCEELPETKYEIELKKSIERNVFKNE
jgi:hypothetical protein